MHKSRLKIIFAGTAEFAATILSSLLANQQNIIAVYTAPDRPAGRGLKIQASPVKIIADQYQVPLVQPTSLHDPLVQQKISAWQADLMIVAAYGFIIPRKVLQIPALGCVNLHASLLPRWRGASPVQQAIWAGDPITGITLMQIDSGLDTGAILSQHSCAIHSCDTAYTLTKRLADLAAEVMITCLPQLSTQQLLACPQPDLGVTYAPKLSKADGLLDWSQSALAIDQKIRALNPWPIAFTSYNGNIMRIFAAEPVAQNDPQALPGTIVNIDAQGIDVATGNNCIRIKQLQISGSKVLEVKSFLNAQGRRYAPGMILGT